MNKAREIKKAKHRFTDLLELIFYAAIIGVSVGLVGTAFDRCLEFATEFRTGHSWLIYFLPVAALGIVFLYHKAGIPHPRGTNRIILAAKGDKEGVALRAVPLIFVATTVSHFFGASVGREGAALQLGGAMASFVGRKIRLSHMDRSTIIQCGMAAGFSALFGAPLAAAVFALEIVSSEIHYTAIFPVLLSSLISWTIAGKLGSRGTHFVVSGSLELGLWPILKVILFGIVIAGLSIVFVELLHRCGDLVSKHFPNQYLRAVIFGSAALLVSLCFPSGDYNGAGIGVIERALAGEALPYAFLIKLILTLLSLYAGYKGGLIVPSFFIGATFGCTIAPLFGLPAGFAAGLGMVSFFCSVVNCPITAVVLGYEMFGGDGLMLVALSCSIAYMMSGKYSIYPAQIFQHPKFGYEEDPEFDDYR